ncbi:MAG: hypothetical protein JJT88_17375 [Gammaproteobacteria bacterium]|nr:hypothetical protein [Gammaproteobacteria bacterium]
MLPSPRRPRGGKPLRVERLDTSERLRLLARSRAEGPGYNLLRNNCEHTYYPAREGKPRSPQLLTWTLGLAGAAAGTLLLRHWGGALARRLLANPGPRARRHQAGGQRRGDEG